MNCPNGSPLPACKRQYNLDVYEHGFGCHYCCSFVRIGCIACRTGRYSFHPICAQSCFLSHTPGIYRNWMAMADRCLCSVFVFTCLCRVWANCCESNLSACAHCNCFTYIDSVTDCDANTIAYSNEYSHADSHTQWDSDLYPNLH